MLYVWYGQMKGRIICKIVPEENLLVRVLSFKMIGYVIYVWNTVTIVIEV